MQEVVFRLRDYRGEKLREVVFMLRDFEVGNLKGLVEAGVMELERLGEVKVISAKEILPEQCTLEEGDIDLAGHRRVRQQEILESEARRKANITADKADKAMEFARAAAWNGKRTR